MGRFLTALLTALLVAAGVQGAAAQSSSVRKIAPDVVAPPEFSTDTLQREAPRQPLGALGQAEKPAPKRPDGGRLFNPVATAAGIIESRDFAVTIAGIDVVGADEACSFDGKEWPCGLRARTAFRGFLRGRAVVCDLPPEMASGAVAAQCAIGKQDIGGWLVSNGWARAAAGGSYAEDEAEAKDKGRGIYGKPPTATGLGPTPPPFTASTAGQDILEQPAAEPFLEPPAPAPTPPADPQGLY